MSIEQLIVWNSDLGKIEGCEHEKVLFNFSRDKGADGGGGDGVVEEVPGLKQVSLAEGVVNFVNLFGTSDKSGKVWSMST